jgi:hypothetical protein
MNPSNISLRGISLRRLLGLLMGVAAAPALALPDPTQPPVEIEAPSAPRAAANAAPVNRGLQLVIITHGRRAAIINGHTVELGAKYGDATLIVVNEGSVRLRDSHGNEASMSMFPGMGIRKKAIPAPPENVKPDNAKPANIKPDGNMKDTTEKHEVEKADVRSVPEEEK